MFCCEPTPQRPPVALEPRLPLGDKTQEAPRRAPQSVAIVPRVSPKSAAVIIEKFCAARWRFKRKVRLTAASQQQCCQQEAATVIGKWWRRGISQRSVVPMNFEVEVLQQKEEQPLKMLWRPSLWRWLVWRCTRPIECTSPHEDGSALRERFSRWSHHSGNDTHVRMLQYFFRWSKRRVNKVQEEKLLIALLAEEVQARQEWQSAEWIAFQSIVRDVHVATENIQLDAMENIQLDATENIKLDATRKLSWFVVMQHDCEIEETNMRRNVVLDVTELVELMHNTSRIQLQRDEVFARLLCAANAGFQQLAMGRIVSGISLTCCKRALLLRCRDALGQQLTLTNELTPQSTQLSNFAWDQQSYYFLRNAGSCRNLVESEERGKREMIGSDHARILLRVDNGIQWTLKCTERAERQKEIAKLLHGSLSATMRQGNECHSTACQPRPPSARGSTPIGRNTFKSDMSPTLRRAVEGSLVHRHR